MAFPRIRTYTVIPNVLLLYCYGHLGMVDLSKANYSIISKVVVQLNIERTQTQLKLAKNWG